MPIEPKIIADFPFCPQCDSDQKVSMLATEELRKTGKMAKDAFTHLKMEVVPLEQPVMAGVMVQTLVTHYDVCAKCGLPRCTRAELQMSPVQIQGPVPGNGGSHQPFQSRPR